MENKKEPLTCVICGQNNNFRLVLQNTLMPNVPPYVICLGCINKAKEIQNKNRYDWRIEKPKEDENEFSN